MRDHLYRPPPLELAPPKRQHRVAVPGQSAASLPGPPLAASTTARHVPSASPPSSSPSRRRHGRGRRKFSSFVQLAFDAVQVNICAILIAALGTFLYEVPTAASTRAGSTAMAAITLLTLSIFLSLLSMFRPHLAPNPWTLVVRLILAFSFVAIFLAWVAQVPGPRVFEPPSYRLWDMPTNAADGLIAGVVFLLGVAEFTRAVVWRHTLLGETAQWQLRPERAQRRTRHPDQHAHRRHRPHDHAGERGHAEVPVPAATEFGSWPLKQVMTSTTLESASTASRSGPR